MLRRPYHGLGLFLTVGLILTSCEKKPQPVATVNGKAISLLEFRLRAGFTPYIFHGSSPAQRNREFALSLAGEKMLAQEARKQGLAADPRFVAQMAQLRRELLFEELYAKRIRGQADEDQAMAALLRQVLTGKTMAISHEVFAALTQALMAELSEKPLFKDSTVQVSEREENRLAQRHGDLLKQTLVRFGQNEAWSVADFLLRISVGPYPLPAAGSPRFRSGLRGTIKRAAELEYLSRYAEAEGLAATGQVKDPLQMWSDALLTQMLMQRKSDSITVNDADVQQFYIEHKNDYIIDGQYMPQDSVQQKIKKQLRQERAATAWRDQLQALPQKIWLNSALLDTLQIKRNADLVIKRHFPGRMLAPIVFPFAEFMEPPSGSKK